MNMHMPQSDINKLVLRVPIVGAIFWIIKVLSTTVGETAADFLSFDMGWGMPLVAMIMSTIMIVLLVLQFTAFKRYIPFVYWTIVVLMSIIGTLITDILVDNFGVSLMTLSIVFTITMLFGFMIWYKNEHTLAIHSINTAKREAYYWVIILLAFALGTGAGDLISEGLAMGYGTALILFAGTISIVTIGHYVFKLNAILSFWLAYILTRPLGASLGDFMIQPIENGGLGIHAGTVNIIFFMIIFFLITYVFISKIDTNRR